MPHAPRTAKPGKTRKEPSTAGVVGRVIRAESDLITVEISGRPVECSVRGRLRLAEREESRPVVVGDQVRVVLAGEDEDSDKGAIEEVLPRKSVLGRARVGKSPQVIAANVDQALLVFAAALPDPDAYMLYQLDKLLVQAKSGGLAPLICCNKIDLRPESRAVFEEYEVLGFPVVYTSAVTGEGLEDLAVRLAGKLSVLCGPSGVGKSSLINAIKPGSAIRVGDVSDWTRKGRHTTSSAEMYPLGPETWIVDTPGIRRLDLWKVPTDEVESYFPEISGLWKECRDPDCLHKDELDCAVKRAVDDGTIGSRRYESYRSIVEGR